MGLERTRALLDALGAPDRGLRGVLVGGTNGKGSVCANLVSVFSGAGYRVGSMPKPHLQSYTERVCVDGRPISETDFAALIELLQPAVEAVARELGQPTEFEMLTAAAVRHLRDAGVDLLVCEVGMGGRLDSTNVLDLGVKVITNVALDHQQYLGDTRAAIAREKAGIIHADDDVVTGFIGPATDEAAAVVAARCAEVGARPHRQEVEWRVAQATPGAGGCEVAVETEPGHRFLVRTGLLGAHQCDNAAVAAMTALVASRRHGLSLTEAQVGDGVARARWPGRLELVPGSPEVLIDGAHNPAAVESAVAGARALAGSRHAVCLFGAMEDKDHAAMLRLLPWPAVLTAVEEARACDPQDLLLEARALGRDSDEALRGVGAALERARELAGPGGLVLVLGSLYLAGAVRGMLRLPLPGT